MKAITGAFAGSYLWSNTANCTKGIPADGGSVDVEPAASGSVYDGLASPLTIDRLNLNGNGQITVVNANLTVGTVAATAGSALLAAPLAGQSVTLTISVIIGVGSTYGADGGTFIDTETTDLGDTNQASAGGLVELAAAPSIGSTLACANADSTFALSNPAATNPVAITGLAPGNRLELPGTTVSAVTFGANSLTVTTDPGTYAFTNVTYGSAVSGYTAAQDTTTGLLALTFTGPDVFKENVAATSGPLAGFHDWNNAANWSAGIPSDGDSVSVSPANGGLVVDDLPTDLTLATLILNGKGQVLVVKGNLTVGLVSASPGSGLTASPLSAPGSGNPITVTLGALTGGPGFYGADSGTDDAGGAFIDHAATDAGEYDRATFDGTTDIAAPLASG